MDIALYGQATQSDLAKNQDVLVLIDFLCVERKAHVTYERRWERVEGELLLASYRRKDTWSEPAPCDGSCRVWREQALDMPAETRTACQRLIAGGLN